MTRPLIRAGAALIALACIGTAARAEDAQIKIDNFAFSPATTEITAGSTVTWTNGDDIPHAIAADDKGFRSKPLDSGDHYSFTFTKPGTYGYFCSLHPHMTGKIVVK